MSRVVNKFVYARSILALGRRSQWAPSCCQYRAASSNPDIPDMPPCAFEPQPYTGMSYEDTLEVRHKNINPGVLTYYKNKLLIHQGYMQWLFDHTGRRYLDLFAGIVTVSVGHCHPKVNARLKQQVDRLWHTTNIYMHPGIHEFAEKLTSKLPGDLKVVYFTNSGGEANELAMLMARVHTGAFDIITLRNAYHGTSPYSQGLTALGTWKYPFANGFGIHNAMNADVYRGPWGGANCRDSLAQTNRTCSCPPGQCEAADLYIEQLKDTIRHSVPTGRLAAFFAEPIQGVGGTVQLPRGYLKKAYEVVRESGGLCVADEVQTGFGRLGSHFWGFETHGVVPDIVTMAKGIGNGFPMAAVVTTPEVAAAMSKSLHFNTFGGNPMASAVGSTVLDVIEEEGTQANCVKVGDVFLSELMKLRDEFEIVGDVRGKGLMLGLELVKDKKSREPAPPEHTNFIWETMKDYGVLVGKGGLYANVLRIKPPMCLTESDVHFAIAVMRKVLNDFTKKYN